MAELGCGAATSSLALYTLICKGLEMVLAFVRHQEQLGVVSREAAGVFDADCVHVFGVQEVQNSGLHLFIDLRISLLFFAAEIII